MILKEGKLLNEWTIEKRSLEERIERQFNYLNFIRKENVLYLIHVWLQVSCRVVIQELSLFLCILVQIWLECYFIKCFMDIKKECFLSLIRWFWRLKSWPPSKNKDVIIKKQKQTIFSAFKYFFQLDSISKQNEQLVRLTIYLSPSRRLIWYKNGNGHPPFLKDCNIWQPSTLSLANM